MEGNSVHIDSLENEFVWLEKVIQHAVSSYLMHEGYETSWLDIELPELEDTEGAYAQFVQEHKLNAFERLALILALAPHIKPEKLDIFFGKNQLYDRPFTEFGGYLDNAFNGFLPTIQTLLFIAAASDPTLRNEVIKSIEPKAFLMQEQILTRKTTGNNLPSNAELLCVTDRWLHFFQTAEELPLEQSAEFPAQHITTQMDWEDLVLEDAILEELLEINTWLNKGKDIMAEWGLDKKIKPGYRTLFYGPPGTGKTLTATVLGKTTGKDVFRIDLSMIVSKYIGETEKNLAKIFDIAEHKNWILFFDEADSLFGKRTVAQTSNDRHANQQTGYLLQRIEEYSGVVILASNLKDNIDGAFTRRFQSMIHFRMPSIDQRYQLWQKAFAGPCKLDESIDLYALAENYELAGGAIINVLRHCALAAIKRDSDTVTKQDLLNGLRREFAKEHKTIQNKAL
ncbi:MAG: AAA family ATPase [Crocinitomix sp.]|nr:AAA family ATPase [Crocinitomix sp.]